jgi:hypothetical protein
VVVRVLIGIAVGALVLGLAACGSGGSDSSAPTKAEFTKKADALCKRAHEQRIEDFKTAIKKMKPKAGPEEQKKVLVSTVVPGYEKMISELDQMTPPAGDEEKVAEIVKEMEKVAAELRIDPQSVSLQELSAMANAYGIPECGE